MNIALLGSGFWHIEVLGWKVRATEFSDQGQSLCLRFRVVCRTMVLVIASVLRHTLELVIISQYKVSLGQICLHQGVLWIPLLTINFIFDFLLGIVPFLGIAKDEVR